MPVRDKAEVAVMPMLAGRAHWTMGQLIGFDGLSEEQYWNVADFMGELFVATMEAIDWNRVILEASGMCTEKQTADPDHKPKVQAIYKHDSLIEEHNPDFNQDVSFCADCFRLTILRLKKWEVMEQADVAETLPEERPPEGWVLPRTLARELAEWLEKRKEAFTKAREKAKEAESRGAEDDD